MWETYGLASEDLLWAGTTFTGGISGQQQAPCGAISAAAICLGLRHGNYATDKQKAKQARLDARQHASELIKSFTEKFDSIACLDLVGIDFSEPGGYQRFQESGISKEKCDNYVQFVIEKLYELDTKINTVHVPRQVTIYTKPGCPFCAAAKQDLEERGVPYEELSIQDNPKVAQEVMRLSKGKGIVPILVIGEEVKVGFGGG
ncbi:MAG: C-GCAxxG-C-C family protein [Dehalococcoidia bacterium]|nr:C-GCAxxG-C-C family protein [Dehalococcoidia bacterium]